MGETTGVSYMAQLPCHPISSSKSRLSSCLACLAPDSSSVVQKTTDNNFCPDLLPLDSDEDCMSLSSGSHCSTDSFCSGRIAERRVTFADTLVTKVNTRPRTLDCDKRLLFYTQSETNRFRQVYREERQSCSLQMSDSSDKEPPSSENSCRHRISRVVVEHNESLATFYDPDDYSVNSLPKNGASSNDVFFDNDSFWSGSISWS